MDEIYNSLEKIKLSLIDAGNKLEEVLNQNTELKEENFTLREECKKALVEVEESLVTIESLQTKHVNHNNTNS